MVNDDLSYMQRALVLAQRGIFSTAPNPRVGCVLVKTGKIIGEGWHEWAGQAHAEVNALKMAGENAKGATAYVTLEPCAHVGRTPPCTEALIAAGVAKVVIACSDSNPLVAGKGIAKLQAAGIETTIGVCEAEARELNRGFFQRMNTGRPFVTVKLAASMDGRTALKNGKSQWITGEKAREDVHFHRLAADAIIAGSGSVIKDNARLTARFKTTLPAHQPLKVIVDSKLKTPPSAAIFADNSPVLIACGEKVSPRGYPPQTELLPLPLDRNTGKIPLQMVLENLATRGVNNVFVEAGAALGGAFLREKLVDQLLLYLAPCFIGQDGRMLVELPQLESLSDKISFQIQESTLLGGDLRLTLTP